MSRDSDRAISSCLFLGIALIVGASAFVWLFVYRPYFAESRFSFLAGIGGLLFLIAQGIILLAARYSRNRSQ